MPKDIALWLQQILQGLDGEDSGMIYFLCGNLESILPYTPARLQLGVDMIYRTVMCNLVAVNDYGAFPDRTSFFEGLRSMNPDDITDVGGNSGAGFWHATLVWGTKRLHELIDAYFRPRGERDDKLNPAFIEALEQIFAENGVPWSEKPLLPITPKAAVGATEPR